MSVVNKFVGIGICVLLLAGCNNLFPGKGGKGSRGPVIPKGEKVVAVIGTSYVSAADLSKEIENYNAMLAEKKITEGRIDTREKKLNYLKSAVIPRYLLFQQALDEGLDKDPEIVRGMEAFRISTLGQYILNEELKKAEVTDADAKGFYDSNRDKIRDPETRKVLEIVVLSDADARQIGAQLYQGADFAALARQYSKATSASRGGDLGDIPVPPDMDPRNLKMPAKYYEIAFGQSMEEGSFSPIFKDEKGNSVILKVENIKKSAVKPYSEVKKMLKEYLLAQKQDEVMKNLEEKMKSSIKVQYFEEKVE